MSDELDTIPSEWTPAEPTNEVVPSTYSVFSIKSLLGAGNARFLLLRPTFMALTGNSVAKTAVLEAALFELRHQLKHAPGGAKRELDWRIEQHEILTGADPKECDLWAPFQDEFITDRLALLSIGESTVYAALLALEESNYIYRRRKGGRHNDRMILLNTKQIERDLQDHPSFPQKSMKPVVVGQPDALIPEPRNPIFSPIYEGLVRVVQQTKKKSGRGVKPWRAAMVLQRVLWIAELRDKAGEDIPNLWPIRELHETFGWGTVGSWASALTFLVEKDLLIETGSDNRTPYLLPNVELIKELASESGELVTLQKENGDTPEGEQSSSKARTGTLQKEIEDPPKREQGAILRSSKSFSETLPDFNTEREVVATPELMEVLQKLSHSISEQRRITRFLALPFEEGWSSLTFADVADQAENASQAATLYSLARQLDTGARTAIAFHSDEPRAKALVAVLLGYWLDTNVAYKGEITWIRPSKHRATIESAFQNHARQQLLKSWSLANGPLIIENIAEAGTNSQLRDEIVTAIEAHRDAVKPIVFVGIPGTISFLEKRLKDPELADLIVRILNEFKENRIPDDLSLPPSASEIRPFDPKRPFA